MAYGYRNRDHFKAAIFFTAEGYSLIQQPTGFPGASIN
jgi:hypothetical protein